MTTLMFSVLVFVVSALILAAGMDRELNVYDEGVILTGAMRVAAGDIPHSDFYANYGPGQFYLIAALFKFFGQYAVVERVYDVSVRAIIVAACYGLTAACTRKVIALGVAGICGLWLISTSYYGYPIFPVLLLALVSIVVILPVLAGQYSFMRLAASGATIGLAALFRYDVGFFVFAAIAVALALSKLLRSGDHGERMSNVGTVLSPYILGTSAAFLPAAACYLSVASIKPFVHDIFSYPVRYYARMRSLPFPGVREIVGSVDTLAVYLPILICCFALYSIALERRNMRRRAHANASTDFAERCNEGALIALTLISAALYLKGVVRVSIPHMLGSLIPSLVLLAILLERAWHQGSVARILIALLCTLSVASAVYASITATQTRRAVGSTVLTMLRSAMTQPRSEGIRWCGAPYELPRIQCLMLDSNRAKAARYLITHTKPDERIFVGSTRHDRIFANDNLIYFASGRLPATRWHQFDPGLQTRGDVQRDIIEELRARNVRYVVLESEWDNIVEPNESARSSNVHVLDEYIRHNYQVVKTFGVVSVHFRDLQ